VLAWRIVGLLGEGGGELSGCACGAVSGGREREVVAVELEQVVGGVDPAPFRAAANKQFAQAERDLALQAELAYKNTVRDWAASAPAKADASATPGRASQGSSRDHVARQTTSP
jgi:hypothetical protein